MSDQHLAELRNEIQLESAGSTNFEVEAFARVYAKRLEESDQAFDLQVEALQCRGPRGKRLELLGYAEDGADDSLTLLSGRYFGADETLTLTDAKDMLGRATGFIEHSVTGWLGDNLEISSREAEYAGYFREKFDKSNYSRIRVLLITDGVMSSRIKTIDSISIAGIKTTFEIWDQRRILEVAHPETRSEDIQIDFTEWMPNGLPCLVAAETDSSLPSYLAVLPAKVLSDIFDSHGSLLLESNVRTFLSARGSVNQGMQNTLKNEPDRFLAYNNGLTATAVDIEINDQGSGTYIRSIIGWQIVNGGQTTASIAHYLRSGKDRSVEGVSVQMKLVVVDPSQASEIVHSVAKFANSQNRISGADLFSTHDFHIRMEKLSRRLRAPAKEGRQYHSGWFYERARGQWENDRNACGTVAEQRKFELEYPKSQRITKTDWAKYAYCWGKKPHLVSKGAQSVFAEYAVAVDKLWEANDSQFGEGYFRSNIAKAIMYEELRAAVLKQEWYKSSPGFLANIVAYAISRFAAELDKNFSGYKFNFERAWQDQSMGATTLRELITLARAAQLHLTDSNRPQANVTQWAKQQACWEKFLNLDLRLHESIKTDLIGREEAISSEKEDRRQREMDSEFEAIELIMGVRMDVWSAVIQHGSVSPTEADLVRIYGVRKGATPSPKQAAVLVRLLNRMVDKGVISSSSL